MALCSAQILMKLKFSKHIFGGKKTQIPNFMKFLPEGAELFYADGQTDRQDEA